MKKISSFIPKHVVNKKDIISNIEIMLKHMSSEGISNDFQVISLKDGILLISCKNSETATILRFEKRKYLKELNLKSKTAVDDIKVVVT
tara:strand:+ start:785 stop:1051 length:267 start_codon:yes stop_codon:yes gene_type:complete